MPIAFEGRTVAVSGIASGFGRAIGTLFEALGATVFGCDVDEAGISALGRLGEGCTWVNLRDRAAARSWVLDIERERGAIDILVNNAGGVAGQRHRPFEQVTDPEWEAVIDINLGAAMTLARASVPGMIRAGGGAIVNICSGASLRASLTGVQAYCAAKHGLLGLTRQLAHELGPQGIRVNAIAPGFVITGEATRRQWEDYSPDRREALVEGIALRRLGTPEDIARAVAFLASDWAGFVNGQILSVDGGK
jgi:3-oxoacyl-[acyl-carrier protein] reductase